MSSNFHPDGTLFIISGPSGSGKTTLIDEVRKDLEPLGITLYFSVSHTTRRARTGEIPGQSYYFVTNQEFKTMVAEGKFLEWAHVHDHDYGTSKAEVVERLKRGEDVILDIDYQGAKQVADHKDLDDRKLNVFIFPPSLRVLERRLRSRGSNTEQEIQTRMKKAIDEIAASKEFYNYIIINDDLNVAKECLKATIIAKKLQTKVALEAIDKMRREIQGGM